MSNICLYNASLRMDNSGNTAICQGNKYTLNQLILSISANTGGKYTLNQPILSILAKMEANAPEINHSYRFRRSRGQILSKPTILVDFGDHGGKYSLNQPILSISAIICAINFSNHGGQILPKPTNLVDFGKNGSKYTRNQPILSISAITMEDK